MIRLTQVVLATLLTVWFAPKIAFAVEAPPAAQVAETTPRPAPVRQTAAQNNDYEARERDAVDLENFRGGGVSIYIGSGVLLAIVVVLLILILV